MNKKIIVVDNDSGICDSLSTLLRGEGYSVDETIDSGEAAFLIEKNKYDICFFDYKLNGLKGIDLLRMAKDMNSSCAVFIISGMMDIEKLCEKEINAGLVAGLISKPFDIEALLLRIAAII